MSESEKKSALDTMISHLKKERDELQLQMHLAGMEARDEYDRLSGKFDELTAQYEPLQTAVSDTAENVYSALQLAAEEMMNGFKRVRNAMTESDQSE